MLFLLLLLVIRCLFLRLLLESLLRVSRSHLLTSFGLNSLSFGVVFDSLTPVCFRFWPSARSDQNLVYSTQFCGTKFFPCPFGTFRWICFRKAFEQLLLLLHFPQNQCCFELHVRLTFSESKDRLRTVWHGVLVSCALHHFQLKVHWCLVSSL